MIDAQPTRVLFNAATITTVATYTYMNEKTTGLDAWVKCKYDYTVVQSCVATLGGSSADIRVEGRFPASNRAASIYSYHVTAAESVDRVINISEKLAEIRVGVKVSDNTSTPNVYYSSIVFSEIK